MEDLLKVGVIASTHGVRGEVKVFPTTDDPKRYLDLDQVILDTGTEQKIMKIERVRFFKNMVILKFEEFNNRRYSNLPSEAAVRHKGAGGAIGRERIFYCGSDRSFSSNGRRRDIGRGCGCNTDRSK